MAIDHICRNRRCCNPDHLRQVSFYENTIYNSLGCSAVNKLKTSCNRGHQYTSESLKVVSFIRNGVHKTQRVCKICVKINWDKNSKLYYQRRKAQKRTIGHGD